MFIRTWLLASVIGLMVGASYAQEEPGQTRGTTDSSERLDEAPPFSIPVRIIENQESAAASERRETESRENQNRNIIAQERMVDATEAMNRATQSIMVASWVSAFFVLIGTGLLWRTLSLSRQANRSALKAVEVTEIIGLNQLRPWVLSQGPNFYIGQNSEFDGVLVGDSIGFSVSWRNGGHSPAILATIYTDFRVVPAGAPIPDFQSSEGRGTVSLATQTIVAGVTKGIHGAERERFLSRSIEVILFSRVDYFHGSAPLAKSFSEVTYRCSVDGREQDIKTGVSRPRFVQSAEGPQNRAT